MRVTELWMPPRCPVISDPGVFWGLHMGLTQGLLATLVADTAPDFNAEHKRLYELRAADHTLRALFGERA